MALSLDVATAQRALDALVTGDRQAATDQFTDDLVLTGTGGGLAGRTTGLSAALDRFADLSRRTGGTFGTEVEAVYSGNATQLVIVTRHWASIEGEQIRGTQALLVTADRGRIRTIDVLSPTGPRSGVWD